jgi:hypothetical protein
MSVKIFRHLGVGIAVACSFALFNQVHPITLQAQVSALRSEMAQGAKIPKDPLNPTEAEKHILVTDYGWHEAEGGWWKRGFDETATGFSAAWWQYRYDMLHKRGWGHLSAIGWIAPDTKTYTPEEAYAEMIRRERQGR